LRLYAQVGADFACYLCYLQTVYLLADFCRKIDEKQPLSLMFTGFEAVSFSLKVIAQILKERRYLVLSAYLVICYFIANSFLFKKSD